MSVLTSKTIDYLPIYLSISNRPQIYCYTIWLILGFTTASTSLAVIDSFADMSL